MDANKSSLQPPISTTPSIPTEPSWKKTKPSKDKAQKEELMVHFSRQHPPSAATEPAKLRSSSSDLTDQGLRTVSSSPPRTNELKKTTLFSIGWFKNLWASRPHILRAETASEKVPSVKRALNKYFKGDATDEEKALIRTHVSQNKSSSPIVRDLVNKNRMEDANHLLEDCLLLKEDTAVYRGLESEFNSIIAKLKEKGRISQSDKKFIQFYVSQPNITSFGALRKLERGTDKEYDLFCSLSKEPFSIDMFKVNDSMKAMDETARKALVILTQLKRGSLEVPDLENDQEKLDHLNNYFRETPNFKGGDFEAGIEKLADLANDKDMEVLLGILKNLKASKAISHHLIKKLGPEKGLLLVQAAFRREIPKQSTATFFRFDSQATDLVVVFLSQVMAAKMGPQLKDFLKNNLPSDFPNIESLNDPKKQEKYKQYVTKLLNELVTLFKKNENEIPSQVKELFTFLHEELKEKFDDDSDKAKAFCTAIFFLRFVNILLIGKIPIQGMADFTEKQEEAGRRIGKVPLILVNKMTTSAKPGEEVHSNVPELQEVLNFFWNEEYTNKIHQMMSYVLPKDVIDAVNKFLRGESSKEESVIIKKYFSSNPSSSALIKDLVDKRKTDEAMKLLNHVGFELGTPAYQSLENEFNTMIAKIIENNAITVSDKKFIKFFIDHPKTHNFQALKKLKEANFKLYRMLGEEPIAIDLAKVQQEMDREEKVLGIIEQLKNGTTDHLTEDNLVILKKYFREGADCETGIKKLSKLANEQNINQLMMILNEIGLDKSNLTKLFANLSNKKRLWIVQQAFLYELPGEKDEKNFFRANSIATKMLSIYMSQTMLSGPFGDKLKNFLETHLPNSLSEITDFRQAKNEKELQEMQEDFILQVTEFMDKLGSLFEENKNEIPQDIKDLNTFLQTAIQEATKSPEKSQGLTTANFFLRFMCPVIMGAIQIPDFQCTPEQKRAGVYTGKVIQNIANFMTSAKPGDKLVSKEPELQFVIDHFWAPTHIDKINKMMSYVQN